MYFLITLLGGFIAFIIYLLIRIKINKKREKNINDFFDINNN